MSCLSFPQITDAVHYSYLFNQAHFFVDGFLAEWLRADNSNIMHTVEHVDMTALMIISLFSS
jgi:hypothetical protein